MSFKFESNSRYFRIKYEILERNNSYFPQVGLTAKEGFNILYRKKNEKQWYNIDCYALARVIPINMTHFIDEDELYEILIYGPILAKLSKLEIVFSDDCHAKIIQQDTSRNIMVMGGATSFGIGCTTAGLMFSNILERKFDANVYHVTFTNRNYLENINDFYNDSTNPIVDVGIIELDHYSQNEHLTEEYLPLIIENMMTHCKYIIGWYNIPPIKNFKKIIMNNTIKSYIDNDIIEIVDLSYMYKGNNKQKYTFNNYYINDMGNVLIYNELSNKIRSLLSWNI